MFTIHCPRHEAEVILFAGNIVGLRNTLAGIELAWRCHCGETGTLTTGRMAQAHAA